MLQKSHAASYFLDIGWDIHYDAQRNSQARFISRPRLAVHMGAFSVEDNSFWVVL